MSDKYRKTIRKCKNCFEQKFLVGQGFTEYVCQICKKIHNHPNTGTPKICLDCGTKLDQCCYCLKKMD